MLWLTDADESLSDEVKEKMFIFENLMSLDDRGLQRLIRDVANENLLTALKGVDAQIAERFFRNMLNGGSSCREDLEASGPIKFLRWKLHRKKL